MKKTSSLVWRFFDRLEENNRCFAVLCKLCDTQYKYFGNTTNLRTHLVNKHPIQWDLLQNQNTPLDETTCRSFDDESLLASRPKRRRIIKGYKNDNVRYSVSVDLNKHQGNRNETGEESMPVIEIQRVDVLENSEVENDHHDDSDLLVRQMHNSGASDEEWLDEEVYQSVTPTYETQHKKIKLKHIKREVPSPPARRPTKYVVHPPKPRPKPERLVIDSSLRKDEQSVFGEYVANKLRKLKGSQTCGNVQQLITTILWQAEYGLYDSMESVKRIILHSVQEMATDGSGQEHEQQIQDIHSQEAQVQMVIEDRSGENLTEESVRIIDEP